VCNVDVQGLVDDAGRVPFQDAKGFHAAPALRWLMNSAAGGSEPESSRCGCRAASDDREVLADGAGPSAGATGIILGVPFVDHGVKLIEGLDAGPVD
jgi:hypothetical protein